MTDSLKDRIFRYGYFLIAAVIVIFSICIIIPTYRHSLELKACEAAKLAEIERKQHEINELRERQERIKSDTDFIESIARQNNKVYPGEYVFMFED